MENFWQVCAALDNPRRLRMVNVLTVNEPRSVCELAEFHDIGVSLVSRYIRALDDVGLLAVEWKDRKAYYRTAPRNQTAARILRVLSEFFSVFAEDGERIAKLLKYIHSLSHPRRFAIVRFVHNHPGASVAEISRELGIARSSVDRLLSELDHAYIVDMNNHAIPPTVEPERSFFDLSVSN